MNLGTTIQISDIASVFISIIAIVLSIYSLAISRRATRVSVDQQLAQYSLQLNDMLLNNGIKGPYAYYLQIPDSDLEYFTKYAVSLLYHINFLRYIYDNRDVLDENVLFAYKKWAKQIIKPWIDSEENLQKAWRVIVEGKDIYGADFVTWLEDIIR